MTTRAFQFRRRLDPAVLLGCLADFFAVNPAETMVYEDTHDIDGPFDLKPAGRLWESYEACAVRAYLSQFDPLKPNTPGWFAIDTQDPADNEFEDRPLAAVISKAAGFPIVFRDPVPDPRDNPIIGAAQISIDPDGVETELWVVEYDDGQGDSATEFLLRSEI